MSASIRTLLVDDEPDILSISKIALRSIKVWGVPLKVHTCKNKAEGVEYNALVDVQLQSVGL